MGKKKACVFCEIVGKRAKAYRIHEDDLSLGILDINPFTRGHCLVLSKRHVPWWHDLTEEETKSLFSVSRTIARKLKKALNPDFVCLYARGRRIPHTHIFLVPTFRGDLLDRFFNALEKAQEAPSDLASLLRKESMEETVALLKKDRSAGRPSAATSGNRRPRSKEQPPRREGKPGQPSSGGRGKRRPQKAHWERPRRRRGRNQTGRAPASR